MAYTAPKPPKQQWGAAPDLDELLQDVEWESYTVTGFSTPSAQPPQAEQTASPFTGGIKRGFAGVENLAFRGAPALAARELGYDEFADKKLQQYAEREKEIAAQYGPGMQLEDIEDVGSAWQWAKGAAGEAIGSTAPMILGGGIGGIGTRALVKSAAEKAVARLVAERGGAEITKGAAERLVGRAAQKGLQLGAGGGALATQWPIAAGEAFIEGGGQNPGVAMVTGALSAGLDFVPQMRVFNRLTGAVKREAADSYLGFVTKEILKTGALEGTTEAAQEGLLILQNLGLGQEPPENVASRLLNAFAAGMVGGGVFGGVGGGIGGMRTQATAVRGGGKDLTGDTRPEYDPTPRDISGAFATPEVMLGDTTPRNMRGAFGRDVPAGPAVGMREDLRDVREAQMAERDAFTQPVQRVSSIPDAETMQLGRRYQLAPPDVGPPRPQGVAGGMQREDMRGIAEERMPYTDTYTQPVDVTQPLPSQYMGGMPEAPAYGGVPGRGLAGPPQPYSPQGIELYRRSRAAMPAAAPPGTGEPPPPPTAPAGGPGAGAAAPASTTDLARLAQLEQSPEGREAVVNYLAEALAGQPVSKTATTKLAQLGSFGEMADALESDYVSPETRDIVGTMPPPVLERLIRNLRDLDAQLRAPTKAAAAAPLKRTRPKIAIPGVMGTPAQREQAKKVLFHPNTGLNRLLHAANIKRETILEQAAEEGDENAANQLKQHAARISNFSKQLGAITDLKEKLESANRDTRLDVLNTIVDETKKALKTAVSQRLLDEKYVSAVLAAKDFNSFMTTAQRAINSFMSPVESDKMRAKRGATGVTASRVEKRSAEMADDLSDTGKYEPSPSEGLDLDELYRQYAAEEEKAAKAEAAKAKKGRGRKAKAKEEPAQEAPLRTAMQQAAADLSKKGKGKGLSTAQAVRAAEEARGEPAVTEPVTEPPKAAKAKRASKKDKLTPEQAAAAIDEIIAAKEAKKAAEPPKAAEAKKTAAKRAPKKKKAEPVTEPAPTAEPELSEAQFMNIVEQAKAARAAAKPPPAPPAPPPAAPKAAAAKTRAKSKAKSAATKAGKAIIAGSEGLAKLFGRKGTLGMGPVFDEETYAKAKPYFQEAWDHFRGSIADIGEAATAFVNWVLAEFGNALDPTPYLNRFYKEVIAGKPAPTPKPRPVLTKQMVDDIITGSATADQIAKVLGVSKDELAVLLTSFLRQKTEQAENIEKGVPDVEPKQAKRGRGKAATSPPAPAARGEEAGEGGQEARRQPADRPGEVGSGAAGGAGNVGRPGLTVFDENDIPRPAAVVRAEDYSGRHPVTGRPFVPGPEQVLGVNLALSAFAAGKKGAMNADAPGTGKTAQILMLAHHIAKTKGDVLVITNSDSTLAGTYTNDAAAMGMPLVNNKIVTGRGTVYFSTYSNLRGQNRTFPTQDWALSIFDEADSMKDPDSAQSIAAAAVRDRSKNTYFATATPFDKYAGLSYFAPDLTGQSWEAILKRLGLQKVVTQRYKKDSIWYRPDPAVGRHEVLRRVAEMRKEFVRAGQFVRREYPFWGEIKTETFEPSGEALQQQQKIHEFWTTLISNAARAKAAAERAGRPYTGPDPMSMALTRARQLDAWTEPQKVEHTVKRIKEELAKGRSVVVAAELVNEGTERAQFAGSGDERKLGTHNSYPAGGTITLLEKALNAAGIEFGSIYGGIAKEKKNAIDRFQRNDLRVVLMTPKSGGVGINLDDKQGTHPRTMLVMTNNFSSSTMDQMLNRISRRDTASPAMAYILNSDALLRDVKRKEIQEAKLDALRAMQRGERPDSSAFEMEAEIEAEQEREDARKDVLKYGGVEPETKATAETAVRPTGVGANILIDPKRPGWFAVDGAVLKWKAKELHTLSTRLNGGEKINLRVPGEKYPWPLFREFELDQVNKLLAQHNVPPIPRENILPPPSPPSNTGYRPPDARKVETQAAAAAEKALPANKPIQHGGEFAIAGELRVWSDPDLPTYADELAGLNESLDPKQRINIHWPQGDDYRIVFHVEKLELFRTLVRLAKEAAAKKNPLDMTVDDLVPAKHTPMAAERGRQFLTAVFKNSTDVTADQILRALGAFTRNPRHKQLAANLRKLGLDVRVVLTDERPNGPNHFGSFLPSVGGVKTVKLFKERLLDATDGGAFAEEAILHELVHAATYPVLEDPNHPLRPRLEELMRATAANNTGLAATAKENPTLAMHEFVTLAFTNPRFQQQLQQTRVTPAYRAKGFFKDLWQSFVDWVRNVINMPRWQVGVLDELLSYQQQLFTPETKWQARLAAAQFARAVTRTPLADSLNMDTDAIARTLHTMAEKAGMEGYSPGNFKQGVLEKSLGALTMRQIRDFYGNLFGGGEQDLLGQLISQIQSRAGRMQSIQMQADEIDRVWRSWEDNLGGNAKERNQQKQRLYDLMLDSTLFKMHPDRPYDHKSNDHLRQYGDKGQAKYNELARRWQELQEKDPEAARIYQAVRDFNASLWSQLHKAVRANLYRMANLNPELDLKEAIAEAEAAGKRLTKRRLDAIHDFNRNIHDANVGPYFRLSRFGDWVVEHTHENSTARLTEQEAEQLRREYFILEPGKEVIPTGEVGADGKRDYNIRLRSVAFFETMEQAENHAASIAAAGEGKPVVRPKQSWKPMDSGAAPGFIKALDKAIHEDISDPTERAVLLDTVHQMYIKSMPETSAAAVTAHRKRIKGYNTQAALARRSFAQGVLATASHTAHAEHSLDIQKLFQNMHAEVAGMTDTPKVAKATAVLEEMNKRNSLEMAQEGDGTITRISRGLAKFGFFWFLTSPSFWAMNMSQVPMITYPALAARYGHAAAVNELTKAYKAVLQTDTLKGSLSATEWVKFIKGEANVAQDLMATFSGEELAMLEALAKNGLLDLTSSMELIQTARGGMTKLGGMTEKIMRFAAHMPHRIEVLNRAVTALAAYRLARENGATTEMATEAAIDTVAETQYDYTPVNKARYMSDRFFGGARALFLFKQYAQHMTVNMIRYARAALKAETPQERKQARMMLTYLFGTHTLAAGVLGTPLGMAAQGIALALQAVFGDPEEPDQDGQTLVRNFLADMVGADTAEVVARGLPRTLGIDLSRRMSINPLDMWQDYLRFAGIGDAAPTDAPILLQAIGVAGAPFAGFYDAAGHLQRGQTLRAVEAASPKFLRDVVRAYRFNEFGLEDRRGNLEMAPSQFGPLDIVAQGLGIQPGEVAEYQEKKGAIKRAEVALKDRREQLLRSYVDADSMAERNDVWEDVQKFNRTNPALRITRDSLIRSQAQRNKREQYSTTTGEPYTDRRVRQSVEDIGRFSSI